MAVQRVKCPTCKREVDWSQSAFRPFCSERCRLIDLGAWLTERHAIPGEPAPEGTAPETAPANESPTRRS
jgi:endogenous inhibitor of DNA gyrase (YacG/DUF329 family)